MTANIEGMNYRVEFSYRRRDGKNASLARNSAIEGLACCTIVCDEFGDMAERRIGAPVVSVAAVICSAGDNFSRRRGRELAFLRALNDCGILRCRKDAFLHWFAQRFPARSRAAHPPKFRLSLEEIAARREGGEAVRAARTLGSADTSTPTHRQFS